MQSTLVTVTMQSCGMWAVEAGEGTPHSVSWSRPEDAMVGRLLVFVNPHSGNGRAVRVFQRKLAPTLRQNGIHFELIVTKAPNDAHDIVETRPDLATFNAIIILSGDGLVFEVINGICSRPDGMDLLPHLPIGIVPSGSGNGLLASIFAHRGYPLKNPGFMEKAIELVTSPTAKAQPVNLMHAQTRGRSYAAFLSIGWGLMADIDIESEKWRKSLGSNRFVVSALIRCMKLRSYMGKLSFRPHAKEEPSPHTPYPVYPDSAADRAHLKMQHLSTFGQRHSFSAGRTPLIEQGMRDDLWYTSHSVEGVPPLHEPVPSSWTTIHDEFTCVFAVSLSHISNTGPMMPHAKLDDDRIYLTYILTKDVPSRSKLLKYLIDIEEAKHLDVPFLKVVEVTSFRLESEEGRIVLDGEELDTDVIQATVSTHRTAVIADI